MKMKAWGRVALGALRRGGWCGRCLVLLVALLVLIAGAGNSGTWAAPCADSLRQTVPTRTPIRPTATPIPPTLTPVSPSATPVPPSETEVISTSTPVPSTSTSAPTTTVSIQVSPTTPPLRQSPTSASIESSIGAPTASPTSTQEPSSRVSVSVTGTSVPVSRIPTLSVSGQASIQTPGVAKPRVSRSATPPSKAEEVGEGGIEASAGAMGIYWTIFLLAAMAVLILLRRKS